jgi:AcrR family transcriptional regulator
MYPHSAVFSAERNRTIVNVRTEKDAEDMSTSTNHEPRRKRQIERTKETFSAALLSLLARQSLDSITVSALVALSGMSRKSFYRHYSSLSDVLIDDAARLTVSMSNALSAQPSLTASKIASAVIDFWSHHTDVLIALRDARLLPHFRHEWDRCAFTFVQPTILRDFLVSGTFSLLIDWIQADCADNADHIRRVFASLDE